jgi:hypothetical protein
MNPMLIIHTTVLSWVRLAYVCTFYLLVAVGNNSQSTKRRFLLSCHCVNLACPVMQSEVT